jgi:TolB protein
MQRLLPSLPWVLAVATCTGAAAAAQDVPAGYAVPVTYSYNLDPSLSPDGKRMVFLKVLEGHEQLFLADSDGDRERQLTRDAVDHEDPAWSPDGAHIAYVRIESGKRALHVMDVDGGNDRRLTPPTQSPLHPAWMPDGRSILYCTDDDLRPPTKNAAEIYSVHVETAKVRTLLSGGVNTFPVPSPDGKRMAFRKMVGNNSEVFVAGIDGASPRNLTDHPAFEGWPAWSPDGRRIAFAGNRNSSYQIFVMNADGTDVRLVANTEGRGTAPRWSPDGTRIYFTNCWQTGARRACEILRAPAPDPAPARPRQR